MILLVFGRSDSREFTGSFIALNLIGQHEIINLPAASKGFCKQDALFSRRVDPVSVSTVHRKLSPFCKISFILIMKDYICYIRFLARNQNQGRAALIAIYPTTYRRRGFLARGLLNPFCTVRLSICPKVIRTPVYPVGIIAKD